MKLDEVGKSLGNKEITSLGSTLPLMNSSWAFLSSMDFNEMKAALTLALFKTSSRPSDDCWL